MSAWSTVKCWEYKRLNNVVPIPDACQIPFKTLQGRSISHCKATPYHDWATSIGIMFSNRSILEALSKPSLHTNSDIVERHCGPWLICNEYHGPLLAGPCQMKSRPGKTSSTMDLCKVGALCKMSSVKTCLMDHVANRSVANSDVACSSEMGPDYVGCGCSVSQ